MEKIKTSRRSLFTLWCATFLLLTVFIRASQAAGLLSPVNCPKNEVKMKSHKVSVVINNGFARTEVDQIFINNGQDDLEAIYSFPLPKKASLSELSLWINGKEVIGEVVPKKKAKELYEEQKALGNNTALAEQDSFKTFEVRVFPVTAGLDTRVRLVYYQALDIDLNIGRYIYPLAEGGVDEEKIAFWSNDDEVLATFSFNMKIKSAFPIKNVRLPNHSHAQITRDTSEGGEIINISVVEGEGARLDKDIVTYYRLDSAVPARVELIPYREAGTKEGTFMAVITPGASLKPIQRGTDWTFVLDKSGSMSGGKIVTLCEGVKKTIKRLRPDDRFRIIVFNDRAKELTNGFMDANQENLNSAFNIVSSIQADGSTNMYDGLSTGLADLDADRTQGIILVTDGVTNTGLINHSDFMDLIAGCDVRLFTFVIGNSANRPLLEDLARESNGFAMNVSESDDIIGRIMQAQAKVLNQNMRNVSLSFQGGKVTQVTPRQIPSLYMGKQMVVFGTYQKAGPVTMTFKATIEGEEKEWSCQAELPSEDIENPEIERLWAYAHIDEIMAKIRREGEKPDLRKKVVNIATENSLVTQYTSMLVLTDEERERLGLPALNAKRVQKERMAQQARNTQPVRNRRVDNKNGGMFRGLPAPDLGSGPIGPLFIGLIALFSRLKKNRFKKENK